MFCMLLLLLKHQHEDYQGEKASGIFNKYVLVGNELVLQHPVLSSVILYF